MPLTPEEQQELAALEAQYAQPKNALTAAEQDELAQLEAQYGEQPGIGSKILSGVGSALDYAGGVSRAVVANALADKEIASKEDLLNALKGNAPSTSEYLKRAGVPEGYSLSDVLPGMYSQTGQGRPLQKGGWADPTARGAAGFVGDVALDPLTYLSMGASVAAKAGKGSKLARGVLNPVEAALEAGGKKYYKSAFKNIDKDLLGLGKAPISDEMLRSGFTGSMQKASIANKRLMSEAGEGIGETLKTAAQKGATISTDDATKGAIEIVAEMRTSPHIQVQAAADKMDNIIMGYLEKGEAVPVDLANQWKSQVNELAGKRAFNPLADSVPLQDKIEREIGSGLSTQIKSSVGKTDSDLLKQLEQYNQTYGSSKEARKAFKREANKEITKNPITVIDLMLAGGAGINPATLGVLGLKKVGEKAMSAAGRTTLGKGAYDIGRGAKGLIDTGARRSVYEMLKNKENEK